MSEHDDSGEHRRRSSGGGVGRWLTLGGWLLAAVLGGNLLVGQFRTAEGGRPSGFLSEKAVVWGAFWVPLAVLAGASVLGIVWTMKIHARREKSSLLWMRNAYVFGLVAALLLVVAVQDPKNFNRPWLGAWCTLLLAAQVALFVYATFRELRRISGHRGRGGDGSGEDG